MARKAKQQRDIPELNEADKGYITEIFLEKVAPWLRKRNARIGVLNCDFAGKRFKNWNVRFRSVREDFEIVEFEYDEQGSDLGLYVEAQDHAT